jgi:hypothetical protein
MVGDAKTKLTKFGMPVPQPDPTAVARMQKEEDAAHNRPNIVRRSMGVLKNGPDVSMSAHSGPPTMTPASETGDETLSFGGPSTLGMIGGSGTGSTATVETVTPGTGSPTERPAANSADPAAPSPSDSSANPPATTGPPDPSAAQPADSTTPATPADKSQESTSKKKKGLRKIIPF